MKKCLDSKTQKAEYMVINMVSHAFFTSGMGHQMQFTAMARG